MYIHSFGKGSNEGIYDNADCHYTQVDTSWAGFNQTDVFIMKSLNIEYLKWEI